MHEKRIFVHVKLLGGSQTSNVHVYDISGRLITKWNKSDHRSSIRPAVVSNQIVVPDYMNNQLTVYSLTGQVSKRFTCPQLSGSIQNEAIACAVDNESVIVIDCDSSQVFKVNINTEETVWTCYEVAEPQAVAIYGKDFVCVGSRETISFLNINTG